ncbi:pyocin knob domain-containing protein [Clostridium sp. BJN0013]|uniref:pyocin knob domain-containing protein n=1 Tax=Clostridium sp. BJN0013 TaxID=3236840 RepID=UPI0034C634CB
MPSANKTPNIGLNQWQGNEYPKRQDFVDDNAAVDLEMVKKASSTQDGRMSKEDKVKLDGISAGANKVEQSSTNGNIKINGTEKTVYTHPGSGTNPHGTTKSDVGLGNVTNDAQVKRTEMGADSGVATLDSSGVNAQAPKVHTHTKAQIIDFPTSMPANGGDADTATKLATPRTISLEGDATGSTTFDGSVNKSITVVLANSGATAGTYTKLTIDAKGRVTSATTLSASDIPSLDWSKITSGKPTTLAGYGITDAVSKYVGVSVGTDLNTVLTSGFYRLHGTTSGYTNIPTGADISYGQLIVSRGLSSVFQIITGHNDNEYYMRQGSMGEGTDTNFADWQPWRRIWHDGNFNPTTKADKTDTYTKDEVDNKILYLGTTSNSGNAYSVSAPEGFTLKDNQLLIVKFNAASTGEISLNVSSTGVKPIKDYFGNAVTNVRTNLPAILSYESSSDSFILSGKGGDGDALTTDIRQGKKATTRDGFITGTLPVQATGSQTVTPGTSNIVKPAGIYDEAITVKGEPNLIAPNLVAGKSYFGIQGSADIESLGGKKYASGTGTFDSIGHASITTLNFTPSTVIMCIPNYRGNAGTYWLDIHSPIISYVPGSGEISKIIFSTNGFSRNEDNDFISNTTYNWLAIE